MLGDFVSFLCSKASPATPPFRNCPQTSFLKSFQYNFILQSVDEMMEQLISSSKYQTAINTLPLICVYFVHCHKLYCVAIG